MGARTANAKVFLDKCGVSNSKKEKRSEGLYMQSYIRFPDIGPNLFSINLFGFELALRYYALAYIAGLILGFLMVRSLMRKAYLWKTATPPTVPEKIEDLLTYIILGVIIGGRLGFTLLYQPDYYLSHPIEILYVWQGGMSFHGGFMGVIVAGLLFCRVHGARPLGVGDAMAAVAPIGLFFGRVANFINAELWGRPTDVPWAVLFPGERALTCPEYWEGLCTRHPSQLYEALLEGVLLFAIMLFGINRGWLRVPGRLIGVFFLGYGLARTFVEYFRQADAIYISPDNPFGHVFMGLTMGQLLSLPMVLIGIVILIWSSKNA